MPLRRCSDCATCRTTFVTSGALEFPLLTRGGDKVGLPLAIVQLSSDLCSRYQLGRGLCQGAAGVVLKANQVNLNRQVAMKFLIRIETEQLLQRFLNEARTLAISTNQNTHTRISTVRPGDGVRIVQMEMPSEILILCQITQ